MFEAFGNALNLENRFYQNFSGGHGQYTRRRKTHSETVPVANPFPPRISGPTAQRTEPLFTCKRIVYQVSRKNPSPFCPLQMPWHPGSPFRSVPHRPWAKRIICQVSRKTPHRFAPYKCRSIPEAPFAAYLIAHGKRIICQVSRKTPHRFAPYKCRSIPEPPFAACLIAHRQAHRLTDPNANPLAVSLPASTLASRKSLCAVYFIAHM